MQTNALFYKLEIEHSECWTNYVPVEYNDMLIGYTYYNDYLNAIRLTKDFNKCNLTSLKSMIKKDKSVKLINAYSIDSCSSIISMSVDYHESFLDRLIALRIFPIKSSVSNRHESYIFISEDAKIGSIRNELKDCKRVKIIMIQEIKSEAIVPEIGNCLIDIFLTDREKEIMKFAKENGFFNIPRKSSNTELASQLNISKIAMNVEIRKALNKIVNEIYK